MGRDECYPDLTLIPVIAEIFNVTSDEILKGARIINDDAGAAAPDTDKSQSPKTESLKTESLKKEKQIKRLIQKTLLNFKQLSLIAFFTSFISLFFLYFGMTSNWAWAIFSVLFSMVSVIIQIIFSIRSRVALFDFDDEIIFDKRLIKASKTIENFTFNIITINAILLLGLGFIYIAYKNTESDVYYFPFFALMAYICACVVKMLITDKKYYDITQPQTKKGLKKMNVAMLTI